MLFFFIFFVCLVVILLILCVIPLWGSATAHSPSSKELNFSLRKIPVFKGVAHWQTNFTLSCVIPLWESLTANSPSGKELKLSPQKDARFSGRCNLASKILLYPASSLLGTHQQLTHPSSQEDARFQGAAPWHRNFTSSWVIPLWDSATTHSLSGKVLISFSQEESCLSGLIVV